MSYVEIASLKNAETKKNKIKKMIDNKNLQKQVQEEINPRPFKFSIPKFGKSYAPSSDGYIYKEWNDLIINDICLDGYNKCTYNDENFRNRFHESKDLTHALKQCIGFEVNSDLYGGLATLLAITADHGIKTKMGNTKVSAKKEMPAIATKIDF